MNTKNAIMIWVPSFIMIIMLALNWRFNVISTHFEGKRDDISSSLTRVSSELMEVQNEIIILTSQEAAGIKVDKDKKKAAIDKAELTIQFVRKAIADRQSDLDRLAIEEQKAIQYWWLSLK